ncbi:MAG: hypothetical protein JKX91_04830 [Rhizobiaceae bacterium]|nr:hypothetical protein [Rhizobiaceae bacterium]
MRITSGLCYFIVTGFLLGASVLSAVGETIRCEPAYSVFCQNVHIGCAGRTSLHTEGFSVIVAANGVDVIFDGGEKWTAHAPEREGERVIRKSDSRDWIRIDHKDSFSHRIYRKNIALIAYGKCARD